MTLTVGFGEGRDCVSGSARVWIGTRRPRDFLVRFGTGTGSAARVRVRLISMGATNGSCVGDGMGLGGAGGGVGVGVSIGDGALDVAWDFDVEGPATGSSPSSTSSCFTRFLFPHPSSGESSALSANTRRLYGRPVFRVRGWKKTYV